MKAFWLLIIGALLAIFLVQNWQYPNPPVQFLGYHFLPLPQSAIILGSLVLGFLFGWLTHALKAKRTRQEQPPE